MVLEHKLADIHRLDSIVDCETALESLELSETRLATHLRAVTGDFRTQNKAHTVVT